MKSIGPDDPNDAEHFVFGVIKATDFDEKIHDILLEVEKKKVLVKIFFVNHD